MVNTSGGKDDSCIQLRHVDLLEDVGSGQEILNTLNNFRGVGVQDGEDVVSLRIDRSDGGNDAQSE